jgi:hypothetical protein
MRQTRASEVNILIFKLTLNIINIASNDIPLEGLGHRLIIAPRNFQHQVFVEVGSNFIDGIDSRYQLILLLAGDV